MPNRFIKESARTSPTLDQLSDGAERMFWRLTTVADDYGRFDANPSILLATCFPLKVTSLKIGQIVKWYHEMEACKLVQSYDSNGKHLGFFTTWDKHQTTRAKYSKFPDPGPESICKQMQANVSVFESEYRVTSNEYRDTEQVGLRRTKKPYIAYPADFSVSDEIRRMAQAEGWPDPDRELKSFRDWALDKQKTSADWEARFRNWLRKAKELGGGKSERQHNRTQEFFDVKL